MKCSQKPCCIEAWCMLLCSGHGWSRRLRMQKWRSAWSLPRHCMTACSDCLQVKLWGCILRVFSTCMQGFIFKCEWFIPVWVGEICRIKTGMGMFPIAGLGIGKPASTPLRLSRPLLPLFFSISPGMVWEGIFLRVTCYSQWFLQYVAVLQPQGTDGHGYERKVHTAHPCLGL